MEKCRIPKLKFKSTSMIYTSNYNRTHSQVYFYSEIEINNDVVKVTNYKDYQRTHSNTNGVNSH